jgi:CDP-glucose 4,6-dehydratase
MNDFESALTGKRIFITGHTGFTGSWASIWLNSMGAELFGYSLVPETSPNLFTDASIGSFVAGVEADIRDFDKLQESMATFQPDLVLHLAAQPLVRRSYRMPRETFEVNVQGTANVLEAARNTPSVRGILCITTDKVYKNLEIDYKYKESDELGGKDPYSASKAAAELVISSFRQSFEKKSDPLISVARGGNIIGGGDWSEDRLIPDFIRALKSGQLMSVRYPDATRPWQHVLALVEGYCTILAGLLSQDSAKFAQSFNLGPMDEVSVSVKELLSELGHQMSGVKIDYESSELAEAGKLALDSSLASKTFGWNPSWSTQEVIKKTSDWYQSYLANDKSAYDLCAEQIDSWKASKQPNRG